MKLYCHLFIAGSLLLLPACNRDSSNQSGGVKDAIGSRPYEDIRDAAEDAGDSVKEAGQDLKNVVTGS